MVMTEIADEVAGHSPSQNEVSHNDTLGIVQDEISAKQVIIDFGHISGLTLNMTKTEAVWLGVNRNRIDKPLNIRWPALPITVLGVYFGYDRELCEKKKFRG